MPVSPTVEAESLIRYIGLHVDRLSIRFYPSNDFVDDVVIWNGEDADMVGARY
jgi:hypothetical protein